MDDELDWWNLALCKGMNDLRENELPHHHEDYFFEKYEEDAVIAANMDNICISCPVRKDCLMDAVENKDSGLRGGIYLNKGRVDQTRNQHKTPDIWEVIRSL